MKVLATPKVLEYIENLVPILYEKGYFSFEDTARRFIYFPLSNNANFLVHLPRTKKNSTSN